MVDIEEVVLGVSALAIMVVVPISCVVIYDLIAGRWDGEITHWQQVRMLRHTGPPIEQVAADLRRLRSSIVCDADRSATHQIANRLAYDRVLDQACRMLAVENELSIEKLTGIDREIERVRVEAALEREGLVLTPSRRGQPH